MRRASEGGEFGASAKREHGGAGVPFHIDNNGSAKRKEHTHNVPYTNVLYKDEKSPYKPAVGGGASARSRKGGRTRTRICIVCRRPSVGKRCVECYRRHSNRDHYTTQYDTTTKQDNNNSADAGGETTEGGWISQKNLEYENPNKARIRARYVLDDGVCEVPELVSFVDFWDHYDELVEQMLGEFEEGCL